MDKEYRIASLKRYIAEKEHEIAESEAYIRFCNNAINDAATEIEELGGHSNG